MYKCCIFDLDGPLLDTLDAITYTANVTLEAFGYGPIDREVYKVLVGDGAAKLVERFLIHSGDKELVHFEEALALYQEKFAKYSMKSVAPYEGIRDLLKVLKEKGIKIAVLSNKPHKRTIENIETFFGKGYFDHVQGEMEDKGIKRKPDPSGVFQIMDVLHMTKGECLYIGDTNTDMMTGQNAGLDTVGVTWGFRPVEELESFHPAYIVNHPLEIANIIKE